jgi:hypothetical protein
MARIFTRAEVAHIIDKIHENMPVKVTDLCLSLEVDEGDTVNVTYTVSIKVPSLGDPLVFEPDPNEPPLAAGGRRHRRINLRDDTTG